MDAVTEMVYNILNSGDFKGMCTLFGLFLVGDGMAAPPSAAGHDTIAANVIKVCGSSSMHPFKRYGIYTVAVCVGSFVELYI